MPSRQARRCGRAGEQSGWERGSFYRGDRGAQPGPWAEGQDSRHRQGGARARSRAAGAPRGGGELEPACGGGGVTGQADVGPLKHLFP